MTQTTCGIGLWFTLLNLAVLTRYVLTSQVAIQGQCDTDRLGQFKVECITENGEVSHRRMVSSGTKCLVGCSRIGVSSRGYRVCRNGNWEGNVINCTENTPNVRFEFNRTKRGIRRCTRQCKVGWWWASKCNTSCIDIPTIKCPNVPILQYTVRGSMYANVSWNPPTASGGVGSLSINQTVGLPSGSRFYGSRNHTITYKVVDSQGSESSCSFSFLVIVECPPGTYYSTTNETECILCGRGTYQPYGSNTSCLDCPAGFTTEYIGSLDASNCSVAVGMV